MSQAHRYGRQKGEEQGPRVAKLKNWTLSLWWSSKRLRGRMCVGNWELVDTMVQGERISTLELEGPSMALLSSMSQFWCASELPRQFGKV
jgi:hypothetical protein